MTEHTAWPTTGPAEDFSDLDSFGSDYKPEKAFMPDLETLANGVYDFEILHAELTKAKADTILRIQIQPAGAVAVRHTYWLNRQEGVNGLAADLCVLGFDSDKWGPAFNRPLSVELPKVVARLKGLKFRGAKTSREDKRPEKKGTWYHDLVIQTLLKGQPMPALTPPVQQPQTPPAPNGPPSDDIPFSWLPFLPWVAALGAVGGLLA